jgi:hypothetical protein
MGLGLTHMLAGRIRLTLPGGEVDRLCAWVDQPGTDGVVIAAADQEAALSASTAERTLTWHDVRGGCGKPVAAQRGAGTVGSVS